MWGLLANLAGEAFNLWSKKEAIDEANDDYDRKVRVTKALAAEQLAITYNSISTAIMRTNAAAYRKEQALVSAERQAEGSLAVKAAQLGVSGKRAELARAQATAIPTERELIATELDRQAETDDLIKRGEMEERATVNRLISNMPNVPNQDMTSSIIDAFGGGIDAYSQFKADKKERETAITQGAIKAAGGVQAKLG